MYVNFEIKFKCEELAQYRTIALKYLNIWSDLSFSHSDFFQNKIKTFNTGFFFSK